MCVCELQACPSWCKWWKTMAFECVRYILVHHVIYINMLHQQWESGKNLLGRMSDFSSLARACIVIACINVYTALKYIPAEKRPKNWCVSDAYGWILFVLQIGRNINVRCSCQMRIDMDKQQQQQQQRPLNVGCRWQRPRDSIRVGNGGWCVYVAFASHGHGYTVAYSPVGATDPFFNCRNRIKSTWWANLSRVKLCSLIMYEYMTIVSDGDVYTICECGQASV